MSASGPSQGARGGDGEVALAEVEHVGAGGVGDVGAVVHGEEFAMAAAGVGEDLEQFQFLGGFQALVPQLDDVDAAGEDGVEEGGEVVPVLAGVRAEVETGVREYGARRRVRCPVRHVPPLFV
ncbi:hypothetical protein GA0115252_11704 [Streptomyces sp. DfronAA-171]|nr:hypothetical protein GA0115252_11704 [Streptomyces sp. DfronAA-171]